MFWTGRWALIASMLSVCVPTSSLGHQGVSCDFLSFRSLALPLQIALIDILLVTGPRVSAASSSEVSEDDPEHQYREDHLHRRRLRHNLTRRHLSDRHRLRFSQMEYRQTVPENIPLHTSILKVTASDPWFEDEAIKYEISDTDNFMIDKEGIIYNVRSLDFEHTSGLYELQVTASFPGAEGWGRRKAVTSVYVRVTDASEPPYFESSHYYFSVPETAQSGASVGRVLALDDDQDLDTYALDGVDPPDSFAMEGQTGVIRLGDVPPSSQWVHNFQAAAVDFRGHVTFVPVTVYVIASLPSYARLTADPEENRHRPVFPECSSYNDIHVRENMTADTPVVLVLATDKDRGRSGSITYSLINDFGTFAIRSSNQQGQIVTTRRLDRENGDKEFLLTVIARDGGVVALQDSCSFRVVVEDVNDNSPIFDQPRYDQTIATDHRPGTSVMRVAARDLDMGDNALISYKLQGNHADTSYFSLDRNTGVITLIKKIEDSVANSKTFEIAVRAEDKGRPVMWSTAPIRMPVVSSGEMAPSIVLLEPIHPTVFENTPENTPVVTICARSNMVGNDNVYFTLLNGDTRDTNADGTFTVSMLPDSKSQCREGSGATIFVASRTIDYESEKFYNLLLQVVNDQNARVDRKIRVEVKDVNDNAPLLQPFDGAVLENSGAALITTIQALDKDASPQYRQLTYSFDKRVTDDVRSKFTLRPNGELWTTRPLDREETRQYRVPIQVTDGKPEHVRRTIYWITVQDLNDVAPKFDMIGGVYEVQLPENREVGKPTGIKLKYEDPDIVNDFTYEIVHGNEEGKFRIDAAGGEVLVNKPLDFDSPVTDRNFTMRVRLSDGTNEPAETDITIAVTNVNDLQPVFEKTNYTFVVTENTECNTTFGKVSALDPDLPPTANQNILYYLSPDELRNFTIGSTSGNLSINGCLDREAAKRSTMILYPRANDEGGRGHDADPATVLVTIIDLNDNHPHIEKPESSYTVIQENLDPGLVDPILIQLNDLDNPENGCPCTMEIHPTRTPVSVREKFALTPLGGSRYELRPRTTLDREDQKIYQLPLTTRDSLGLTGVRYLTIEVGDMNDSPMTDGWSTIKVYNYQGQFSSMIIGSVHVTDLDDHDLGDKNFEVDATTASDVATHFQVDHNSGKITMLKGTPAGRHVLRVKVQDRARRETAIGEVLVIVVDLTLDAVMQSGSLRVNDVSSTQMLQKIKGRSMYEHLKREIARLHDISDEQVDVFSLKDVDGGVDIRYNCHSSPYYTAARLDGLLLQRRHQVQQALGVEIALVDINLCLYEKNSPCGSHSCQHTMRPNLTAPLVIASDTTTLVGVDIADDYTCDCGALEPLPSVCFDGFCYNGGTCSIVNNTLTCACLDNNNYGPRCELMTARFEQGFAWFEPPTVCESPSLSMTFETNAGDGVLLYAGPIVPSPWHGYPPDFIYVFLNNWVLEAYLDLGSGTVNTSVRIERNTARAFQFILSWDKQEITFEVPDCGINGTEEAPDPCSSSVFLPGMPKTQSHLLNVQGPLQIGGISDKLLFRKLSASYGWTLTPPYVYSFSGCVLELRHNDFLFDLNSTDYYKKTYQPCDAPRTSRVVLGQHSVIIILASLLCLLLLVLVILCLARRGRKTVSYPDLDRELVKETMGGADTEGFGEKDVTTFDLKFLQVTPDGYLVSDEDGRIPDVALDASQKQIPVSKTSMVTPLAPLAKMPEGLSIGDFIKDNKKKVDLEDQDVDDVRHYDAQGDEMSAASLSSLNSGFPSTTGTSGRSDAAFDYRTDWGHRFEKLAQIYGRESEQEEDSEYEFPDIPDVPKNHSLRSSSSPLPPPGSMDHTSSSSNSKEDSGSDTSTGTAKLVTTPPHLANAASKLVNGVSKLPETCPRPPDVAEGRADKVSERTLGRTNKEPVTRKIEYREPASTLEVVNGVNGKETWC